LTAQLCRQQRFAEMLEQLGMCGLALESPKATELGRLAFKWICGDVVCQTMESFQGAETENVGRKGERFRFGGDNRNLEHKAGSGPEATALMPEGREGRFFVAPSPLGRRV
jgi:hypothetical protein